MTKTLNLADELKPPLEFMVQKIAILARTGAGKTNTGVVIAEEVMDAKQQIVVMDPKGDWWGLRSSADGKEAGYPITVLGGDHGDLPLEATAGALVAQVAAEGVSLVLDLSTFSGRELRQFVTDFAETFYRAKAKHAGAVLLILEECDEVVPQKVDNNNARMVGAIERIVKRGRFRGIGTALLSQRSASVNKDVLTQTEVLIVQQTTSPQDRKAIDLWVEQHPDQEKRAELLANMASLKKGEAFVWSPTFLEAFVRIRFRLRRTYDAGRDVKIGELRTGPKVLAPVDLAALGEKMKATVEKVKAEDPAALREKNRALLAQISRMDATIARLEKTGIAAKPIEKPVFTAEDRDLMRQLRIALPKAVTEAHQAAGRLEEWTEEAEKITAALSGAAPTAPRSVGTAAGHSRDVAGTRTLSVGAGPVRAGHSRQLARPATADEPRAYSEAARASSTGEAGLTSTHQAVLNAALFLESVGFRTPGVPQLALMSKLAPNSGYWRQIIGRLRSQGLMVGTSLTPEGRAQAVQEPLSGAEDVQARALAVLPSETHRKVLRVLLDAYPNGYTQDRLSELSGLAVSSGYGRQIIGRLRSLGVASKGWPIAAAPFLFLEEAA